MQNVKSQSPIGIILGSKKINKSLTCLFGEIYTTAIPLNGKPLVFYILDAFVKIDVKKVYIVVDKHDYKLVNLIQTFYGSKIDTTIIFAEPNYTNEILLLQTIQRLLEEKVYRPVLINYADVLVDYSSLDKEYYRNNFIITKEKSNRCTNNMELSSLVGSVFLSDIQFFYGLDISAFINNDTYLDSNTLFRSIVGYICKHAAVNAICVKDIDQFDNIENYYAAKRKFTFCRFFNNFVYDDLFGLITKYSKNYQKLNDEIQWYLKLPAELHPFTPRIYKYSLDQEGSYVCMEYYGYPPLSELWLYGNLNIDIWCLIIKKAFKVIQCFRNNKGYVSRNNYRKIYINKTKTRISHACMQNNIIEKLFSYSNLIINDKFVYGWPFIEKAFESIIPSLFNENDNCIIHGDLCFSNILYDLKNDLIRLIDARGKWGDRLLFGDIKYDVAKLRHSISGHYDFIIQDLFDIQINENSILYKVVGLSDTHIFIENYFDERIKDFWNLDDIKFIEGLLFISMIPLHEDNENRQIAMFTRGISILNEALKGYEIDNLREKELV